MTTEGVVSIRGGFASGKTTLVPCVVSQLLDLHTLINKQKAEEAERNKVKKYTIAELMADNSSDEEMYSAEVTVKS